MAARVAYGMAIASNMIRAEVIDGEEFPDLARKYRVTGVPKTIINDRIEFLGAAPEKFILEKILTTQ